MATTRERVAERYPSLLPLLRHPEIGKLLTQAVQKNWSPGVFQSKFIASKWFRSQSEAQRRWWVLGATDPTQARSQRALYSAELSTIARSMGVALSAAELKYMTEMGLMGGYEPDSAFTRERLIRRSRTGALPQGALRTVAAQIRQMGETQYFLPTNDRRYRARSEAIALGKLSMEDVENEFREEAVKRFPHMKDDLAMGRSVADIMAPYAEIYAAEMDMAPEEVMRSAYRKTDPKARELLGVRDPKTGKMRLPTEVEAMRLARSRTDWWQTSSGRQNDASMSDMVTKAMGVRR